ncbi:hypothetical protein DDB_G0277663 [Dictyostelium discoideum AX4]|uniref:CNH domain-containing protein n=1 Tax=Dictyostelium discoideum TaxID=44689 RepID=Q54ZD6_DICDI|nr:hypothetical protein DDB_G0277663 [Dictyostelium discoideum AX4]EAL68649.1 hypothetical protein DDB_G0277663 [Dictyostelium discoideum AX4]|eukprot:XP_642561.1 hypothetical protein DDB_G0277663 [Dictyostelium discoideum AX4]
MLNPFELIPIIKNAPCKIESIEIWQNNIYLGTNDGQILLYIIEKVENNKKITFKSRMENSKSLGYGKKPVDKLLLIADIGKLLTLCDGNLDVFSMYNLDGPNTQNGISTNKGVITFCSKKKSQEFKICVVTKRKLTLYEFIGVFDMYREIALPELALTVEWCKTSLCVGSRKEYAIVDADSGLYKSLLELDKNVPGPRTKLILDQEKFLLTTVDLSVLVDLQGDIVQGSIIWDSNPMSMSYLEPYLITILHNRCINIHDMKNQKLIQELNNSSHNKGASSSSSVISFQQIFEGRGNGKDFIVLYGSSPNSVYCLHVGNIDDLVHQLINRGEHEEAIRLFEIFFKRERAELEDGYDPNREKQIHQARLCKVYELVAMSEFYRFKFSSAFKYLQLSKLDHRAIISFFPTYMPYQTNYRSPFDQSDIFKSIKDSAISNAPNTIELKDVDSLIDDSKSQLTLYLEHYINNINSSSNALLSGSEEFKDLTTVLLKLYSESNKISKLISLLAKCRVNGGNSVINNQFYIQDVEEWLNNKQLYKQLGLVYQYTEKYRKALLLWNRLSLGELSDHFNCNGIEESIQLLECKQNQDILPEPNKELVWEFTPFLIKITQEQQQQRNNNNNNNNKDNQDDGDDDDDDSIKQLPMKIFLKKRKDQFIIDDVIEFLTPFGDYYFQIYLEYLIYQEENRVDYLHTKLATSYIEQIFKNCPELQSSQGRTDIPIANSDRQKLINLLELSNCYNASTLLHRVRNSLLYEELVILYLRIGQYEKMFNIIVWKLNNFKKAEYICESFDPNFSLSITNVVSTQTTITPTSSNTPNSSSPTIMGTSPSTTNLRNSIRLSQQNINNINNNIQISSSPIQGFNLINNNNNLNNNNNNNNNDSNLPKSSLYDSKRQELFLCLLRTYLNYKEQSLKSSVKNQLTNSLIKDSNGEPIIPRYIIEFLNHYYEEMDPIKVLALLPNSIPINLLESYLSNSFNYSISQQRESKIVKNLQKSLNLSTKSEYMMVCSASVYIGPDRRCAVCSKPISDRVFVYFPNGTIVHPKCFQIPFICPISARNFKMNPVEFPQSI